MPSSSATNSATPICKPFFRRRCCLRGAFGRRRRRQLWLTMRFLLTRKQAELGKTLIKSRTQFRTVFEIEEQRLSQAFAVNIWKYINKKIKACLPLSALSMFDIEAIFFRGRVKAGASCCFAESLNRCYSLTSTRIHACIHWKDREDGWAFYSSLIASNALSKIKTKLKKYYLYLNEQDDGRNNSWSSELRLRNVVEWLAF